MKEQNDETLIDVFEFARMLGLSYKQTLGIVKDCRVTHIEYPSTSGSKVTYRVYKKSAERFKADCTIKGLY